MKTTYQLQVAAVPDRAVDTSRLRRGGRDLAAFVRREKLLIGVLVALFFTRLWLSQWNSYWYDELLSIDIYGRNHETAMEAVRHLADSSIHPPLYQWILYHWVAAFGVLEAVTRALSNLYITLASLLLFLMLRPVFGRTVAVAATITFAVMYTPFYYAMETRSYAQTILLVTLSSFLLLRLARLSRERDWRTLVFSGTSGGFVLANVALMLTHYYNAFFIAAQAMMALAFVMRQLPLRRWLHGIGTLGGLYVAQAVIFAAVWGSVFLSDFDRRAGAFELDGAADSPLQMLRTAVLQPNLDSPRWAKVAGLLLLSGLLIQGVRAIVRSRHPDDEALQGWTVWYLTGWLLLPLVVVWAAFSMVGVGRYSSRYFALCTVPLAPLVVLTAQHAFHLTRSAVRRAGWQLHKGWTIVAIVVVVAAFILPGSHQAATQRKHDWRGTISAVNDAVRTNGEASYIIYEAANRPEPMVNHYFDRLPGNVRAHSTVAKFEERRGSYRILEQDRELIDEHDHLILVFPHVRTTHLPVALERLEARYHVAHRQLNHMGRGYIVYDITD